MSKAKSSIALNSPTKSIFTLIFLDQNKGKLFVIFPNPKLVCNEEEITQYLSKLV